MPFKTKLNVFTGQLTKVYNDAKIQDNLITLAFNQAIDSSKSLFNLVDGFVDEYEDETGVDTGNSTNLNYDSGDDFYEANSASISNTTFLDEDCSDLTDWQHYYGIDKL